MRKPTKAVAALLSVAVVALLGTLTWAQQQEDFPFAPEEEYQANLAKSVYEKFVEEEGIPEYKGWAANLYKTEMKPWKRQGPGITGAYINLEGVGGAVDNWLMGLEPGAKTNPERHIYDEHTLVLDGEGETHIWRESDPDNKQIIRWRKGSMFNPPLNTWHVHVNTGSKPALLTAETSLPMMLDVFRNKEFVFNNPFQFDDRYAGQPDYFDPENSRTYAPTTEHHSMSIVNFVRDVWTLRLFNAGQGYKDVDRHLLLSDSSLPAHVEQFPVGTYERAHRHNAGATIVLITGTGYSLLWPQEAGEAPWRDGNGHMVEKVPWEPGVLFVPPTQWFHQHFNTGTDPARFVRVGGPPGNDKYKVIAEGLTTGNNTLILFSKEDPYVRTQFEQELAKHGATIKMPSRAELTRLEAKGGRFLQEAAGGSE